MPFSTGRPNLLRRSYTSKTRRKTFVKKSHTRRNISILATLIVVVVIIVALSGALSPPPPVTITPTYTMLVHVYDNRYQPIVHSVYDLNETELIGYVNVTVAGVQQPTRPTPTGIIAYDNLTAGTYRITLSGNASLAAPFSYTVGPNCEDRTSEGQCHALVPSERNAVVLPAYLNRCAGGTLAYHAHFSLTIVINGTNYVIPANDGIFSIPGNSCFRPIHTHDTTGTIHVETDRNRNYTLGDFFQVWGNWENNARRAVFNSTEIFGAHAVNGHTLTMTVNGNPNTSFENYQIPDNAQTASDTCSLVPCQTINIVIMYS